MHVSLNCLQTACQFSFFEIIFVVSRLLVRLSMDCWVSAIYQQQPDSGLYQTLKRP